MNVDFGGHPLQFYREPPLDDLVSDVLAGSGKTLATAQTLPPAAYSSKSFFDLEVEKIFRADWICIGHVSQLSNVGDYFTLDLFGDPIVAVRGPDRIRVMSRVCLHRWAPVVNGAGNTRVFVCPFHNWGYGLDGVLLDMPFMQKAEGINASECRLPELRTEIIEELGLIFVTQSATVGAIRPRVAEIIERLAPYRIDEGVVVNTGHQDVDFNWKIYIETGQECYHHFAVHKETLEDTRPSRLSWCEEGRPSWTVCHSALKPQLPQELNTMGLPNFPGLSEEAKRSISYFHIFPLTRLFARPDRIVLRTVYPLGPTRTIGIDMSIVSREVAAQEELVSQRFSEMSERMKKQTREDLGIDEQQQRGAASSFAKVGRFSHLEASLWHMGEYIRARLADSRNGA